MRRQFAGWPTTNTDMSRPRFLIAALALLGPAAAVVIGARSLRNGAEQNRLLPIRHCVKTADGPYRILVWRRSDAGRKPKPLILYSPGWGGKVDVRERLPAHLAEQGYIVVAFDDVARDKPAAGVAANAWLARTEAFAMGNPPNSRVRPPLLRPGWNWPFARLAGS